MSWWFTAATVAAGTVEAYSKKKGRLDQANDRRRAAHESLLTASYNIRERTKEGRQTQFQVLETGGNVAKQIAIKGLEAEGAAEVAGASAGATIDSGTPRAALASIVQQALAEQTNVIIDTKNRIKAIARDTTNINTSEWRNAKLNKRQQDRVADTETKAANREWLAGMIKTGVKAYGAYKTASTWKGVDTDSSVKVASDARSATGGKGNLSLASSPYNQRGYTPTDWDRFKFNLKNRPFSWSHFRKGKWGSASDWRSSRKTYK